MKDRRESYRSYVNESAIAANVTGTWDRVMSFKEDETDQRIANQCVVHYLDYDRDKIVSGTCDITTAQHSTARSPGLRPPR